MRVMRTVRISQALPPIPVIALGIDDFGSGVSEERSFALLDAFVAGGGTMIDTAHVYGSGASERCLGHWMAARGNRARVLVSSKCAHPSNAKPNRLDAEDIASDLTESLARLGTAHIDLYWLHRDDPSVAVAAILQEMERHRRAGRILAYGASNWSSARLEEAAACASRLGIPGFCAAQQGFSLAERVLPGWPGGRYLVEEDRTWHRRSGLALAAYTPQARGFFAKDVPEYDSPANRARRERARELAHRRGATPNQVALAWLTNQSFPGIAIAGSHRAEQLADCLGAGAISLTADEVEWLASGGTSTG
jgi:aryl-alcohol dehydrogenase-like predicted oxidoreductase